jgi:hypothetical protein
MAPHAVTHLQGSDLLDLGHGLDLAVADGADLGYLKLAFWSVALGKEPDVGFVDETDVVRDAVHPFPIDGLLVLPVRSKFLHF